VRSRGPDLREALRTQRFQSASRRWAAHFLAQIFQCYLLVIRNTMTLRYHPFYDVHSPGRFG
jgi:hypothetical protein